jgi:hypothetical protein
MGGLFGLGFVKNRACVLGLGEPANVGKNAVDKSLLWFGASNGLSRGDFRSLKWETCTKPDFRRFSMAAEIVKKTKTLAKSKSAAKAQGGETEGAVKAAPAVAAKKTAKSATKAKTVDVAATKVPSYTDIAQLAERYWAERGWQDGHAEQDWLRAERELSRAAS